MSKVNDPDRSAAANDPLSNAPALVLGGSVLFTLEDVVLVVPGCGLFELPQDAKILAGNNTRAIVANTPNALPPLNPAPFFIRLNLLNKPYPMQPAYQPVLQNANPFHIQRHSYPTRYLHMTERVKKRPTYHLYHTTDTHGIPDSGDELVPPDGAGDVEVPADDPITGPGRAKSPVLTL